MNVLRQTAKNNRWIALLSIGILSIVLSCAWVLGPMSAQVAQGAPLAAASKACKSYVSERVKTNYHKCQEAYADAYAGKNVKCNGKAFKNNKAACEKGKKAGAAKGKKDKEAAKKKYKNQCKTAAAKKKAKCKKLATVAGIKTPKPSPAGTAINKCGDVDTAFNYGCSGADSGSSGNNNPIFQVLFFIVNIVALGVGMAAIGGVIYGAILYTSAGDNGEQTKKGINIVVNAVLGVVLFAFMYAILNFLVPGGLFAG